MSTSSRESRNRPTAITAVPTIGNGRYRPQRVIRFPLTIDVTSSPPMSGVSSSPDLVGLDPFVTWR